MRFLQQITRNKKKNKKKNVHEQQELQEIWGYVWRHKSPARSIKGEISRAYYKLIYQSTRIKYRNKLYKNARSRVTSGNLSGNKTTQNPSGILTVTAAEPGWDGERRFSGATAISVIVRPMIASSTAGQRPGSPSRGWTRPPRCSPVRSHCSSH